MNDDIKNILTAIAQISGALLAIGATFIVFTLERLKRGTLHYRDRIIKVLTRIANLRMDKVNVEINNRPFDTHYYGMTDEEVDNTYMLVEEQIIKEPFISAITQVIQDNYDNKYRGGADETITWVKKTAKSLHSNVKHMKWIKYSSGTIVFFQGLLLTLSLLLLLVIPFINSEIIVNGLSATFICLAIFLFGWSLWIFWKILKKDFIEY